MLICVKVNIIIYKFKSFFHNCINDNLQLLNQAAAPVIGVIFFIIKSISSLVSVPVLFRKLAHGTMSILKMCADMYPCF